MKFTSKVKRVFSSYQQKDLGISYLFFALFAGSIGSFLPFFNQIGGVNGFDSHLNQFDALLLAERPMAILSHAFVMVCFMALPALYCGFGNLAIYSLFGTKKAAFPRLNRFAFYLLVSAFIVFVFGFFFTGGADGFFSWLLSAFLLFTLSILLSSVIFFTTIVTAKTLNFQIMTWPPFIWAIFISSFFFILYLPILLGSFFKAGLSLASVKEQLLFWFFSHPETYLFVILGVGLVAQIIFGNIKEAAFYRKQTIYALNVSGLLGFLLWSDSIFLPSLQGSLEHYFARTLPLIALALLFMLLQFMLYSFKESLNKTLPCYWAWGAFFMLLIGVASSFKFHYQSLGFAILVPSSLAYFVAHFHYIFGLNVVFLLFAGWYYWFEEIFSVSYPNFLGKLQFYSFFCGVNALFLPFFFISYPVPWLSALGFALILLSLILFFYIAFIMGKIAKPLPNSAHPENSIK